jgi:hypothetical protein
MATYKPIQSVVLTSNTASVTFSGIDQGYTDLVIVCNWTITDSSSNFLLTFNGDSTSGLYSKTQIEGTGSSSAISGRSSGVNNLGLESNIATSTTEPSVQIINVMNYSNSTTFKTVLARQTAWRSDARGTSARVGLWRNANAITSITLDGNSTNLRGGSTFSLYGIKSGAPQAFGGDLVTTDGNYWYHAFRTTGSFNLITQRPLAVDCLVVAGGGGGGDWASGGGGAGGVSYVNSLSLNPSTNITVTVGAGGAQNVSGSNSVFGSIISNGGGRGGTNSSPTAGAAGGSGGGGAINGAGGSTTQGNTGGATGYGNNGGTSTSAAEPYSSAGGGGAGGVGASVSTSPGGAGGVGITNSTINTLNAFGAATSSGQLSGGNYYYAGGGGGASSSGQGAGGLGGGGAGINNAGAAATAGTANTGGGGGGQRQTSGGGAGGSGIVIVRYPV